MNTPTTDDETLDAIVAEVEADLAPFGWRLEVSHSEPPPGRTVSLIHPVALEYAVGIRDTASPAEVRRHLDWAVNNYRDIELTRDLPENLSHHALMYQLRIGTTQNDWSPTTLRQILLAMLAAGSLTEAEATWVLQAGPVLLRERNREWEVLPPIW